MKIVINALSARLGGGQTYIVNLLGNLPARQDLDIVVYAPASLKWPTDVRVRRGSVGWPTTNPLLRTLWERFRLPQILRAENAQILFCPGGVVATRAPAGCKVVTMFRNMIPFDPQTLSRVSSASQKMRNFLLKKVMLRSMASADLTIFISDHARALISKLISVRNPTTIAHGISPAFRTYGRDLPRPDWLPKGEYLLYVSRFDVYKHQLEVAQAYAALPQVLRQRYALLFVGEADNALAKQLAEFASRDGLRDRIVIGGSVPYAQLPAICHHASVNLFASSCENCPNILLEAMGAGRPVLASSIMPMPEFGADAVRYFNPLDPGSLRAELETVLPDGALQARLSDAAALRSADFDWVRTASATWQAMADLIGA